MSGQPSTTPPPGIERAWRYYATRAGWSFFAPSPTPCPVCGVTVPAQVVGLRSTGRGSWACADCVGPDGQTGTALAELRRRQAEGADADLERALGIAE